MATGASISIERSTRPLWWFRAEHDAGRLALRGQRVRPWPDWKRSLLIDSVLRGWPVPDLCACALHDAQHSLRLIDGHERLLALGDFLLDEFALGADFEGPWVGRRFSQLSDELQKGLTQYQLALCIVDGLATEDVEALERRLNGPDLISEGGLDGSLNCAQDLDVWGRSGLYHNFHGE